MARAHGREPSLHLRIRTRPIATPCNALAYGEMRGVRLLPMLGLGMLLNLARRGAHGRVAGLDSVLISLKNEYDRPCRFFFRRASAHLKPTV